MIALTPIILEKDTNCTLFDSGYEYIEVQKSTEYNYYASCSKNPKEKQDFYENAFEVNRIGNSNSDFEPSKIRPFGKWYNYHFSDINLKYVTYGGIFSISKNAN